MGKARKKAEQQRSLALWSKEHREGFSCDVGFLKPNEFAAAPFGVSELPLHLALLTPPGTELAKRVLTNCTKGDGIRTKLREAWKARHVPLCHDTMPPCMTHAASRQKKPKPALCYKAGFCMCKMNPGIAKLGSALGQHVGKLCRKPQKKPKPPLRVLYDRCVLFLRIRTTNSKRILWYHVGWGNLSDCEFHYTSVLKVEETTSGVVAKGLPESRNAFRLVLQDLPPTMDWDMDFWTLHDSMHLVPGQFTGGLFLLKRADHAAVELWRVPVAVVAPALVAPDEPADGGTDNSGAEDSEDRAHEGGEEEQAEELQGSDSDDDDDDGAGGHAGGGSRARRAFHMVALAWALSDEEEEPHPQPPESKPKPPAPPRPQVKPAPPPPGPVLAPVAPAGPVLAPVAPPPSPPAGPAPVAPSPVPPPPAPPPPDPPADTAAGGTGGAVAPKAAAGKHAPPAAPAIAAGARVVFWWGPFPFSRVTSGGLNIGWGTVCKRHHDHNPDGTLACVTDCKKQLTFGRRNPYTDRECIVLLKQWLLQGFTIDDAGKARWTHIHGVDPKTLDSTASDEDLDAQLKLWLG